MDLSHARPPSQQQFFASQARLSLVPSSTSPRMTFKSTDLRSALHLHEAHTRKVYMEGYLLVRHTLAVDGQPDHRADHFSTWTECYVQLYGTTLSIWDAHALDVAAQEQRDVVPTFINVMDALVDYVGMHVDTTLLEPQKRQTLYHVFAVNSAGSNKILFGFHVPPPCDPTKVEQRLSPKNERHPEHRPVVEWFQLGNRYLQTWINAIRLSSWERTRLDEIYTGALIRARLSAVRNTDSVKIEDLEIRSPLVRGQHEGWVRARFMGSTEWRRCWVVLRSHWSDEDHTSSGLKRFLRFGERGSRFSLHSPMHDTQSMMPPTPPQGVIASPAVAYFYDTKRSRQPFASLWHVRHVYAVYPSRADLVEDSVLFKAEGSLPQSRIVSATHRPRTSGWVMFMPDLPPQSVRGANAEMMKWVIAMMDAFRLYGRPERFVWDPRHPDSPFFAYPIGPYKDHLFLDRTLAEYLDITVEDHVATRQMLHDLMAARMRGENTTMLPALPDIPRYPSQPTVAQAEVPTQEVVPSDEVPTTETAQEPVYDTTNAPAEEAWSIPTSTTVPPDVASSTPDAVTAVPTDVASPTPDAVTAVPTDVASPTPDAVTAVADTAPPVRDTKRTTLTAGDFQALRVSSPDMAPTSVAPSSQPSIAPSSTTQPAASAAPVALPPADEGGDSMGSITDSYQYDASAAYEQAAEATYEPSSTTPAPSAVAALYKPRDPPPTTGSFEEAYKDFNPFVSKTTSSLRTTLPPRPAVSTDAPWPTASPSLVHPAVASMPSATSPMSTIHEQRVVASPVSTTPAAREAPQAPAYAAASASSEGTAATTPVGPVAVSPVTSPSGLILPRHDQIYAWPVSEPPSASMAPLPPIQERSPHVDTSQPRPKRTFSRPLPQPQTAPFPAVETPTLPTPPGSTEGPTSRETTTSTAYQPTDQFASTRPPIQVRVVPKAAPQRTASGSRPLPIPRVSSVVRSPTMDSTSSLSPAIPSSYSFLAPASTEPHTHVAPTQPPTSQPGTARVVSNSSESAAESRLVQDYLDTDDDDLVPSVPSPRKPASQAIVTPVRKSPPPPPTPSSDLVPDFADDETMYGAPDPYGLGPTAEATPKPAPAASSPSSPPVVYPSSFGRKSQARLSTAMTPLTQAQTRPGRTPGATPKASHDWVDRDEDEADVTANSTASAPTMRYAAPMTASPDTSLPTAMSQSSYLPPSSSQGHGSRLSTTFTNASRPTSMPPSISASSFRSKNVSNTSLPRPTFVKLDADRTSPAPYAHGLVASASQDKLEKSARQQEAQERGQALLHVPPKPPPPQAGLMGAIHSRERRVPQGERDMRARPLSGASTPRSQQSVLSHISSAQQQQQQQQMLMNMYYWQQQQQMMMMMGMMPPTMSREAMYAQQQAMQAAQQAYYQAYAQHAIPPFSSSAMAGGMPPMPYPPAQGGTDMLASLSTPGHSSSVRDSYIAPVRRSMQFEPSSGHASRTDTPRSTYGPRAYKP
ncbi:hypothetical protein ACI68E_002583 [Malassezia pachydermatis]